ncbi:MAG: hypothetical protein ACYDD1_13010 [Caulobacteraceae bacterium]
MTLITRDEQSGYKLHSRPTRDPGGEPQIIDHIVSSPGEQEAPNNFDAYDIDAANEALKLVVNASRA